jgi:hypothetical protein
MEGMGRSRWAAPKDGGAKGSKADATRLLSGARYDDAMSEWINSGPSLDGLGADPVPRHGSST